MENKIEKYQRDSVFAELKHFCVFSMGEDRNGDFIEVTEWKNGEGFDVSISAGSDREDFKLSFGQFKALKKLIKKLNH